MEEKKVKVFVSGCTGRMGKLVVEAVNNHPGWEVCGGFGRRENKYDFPVFEVDNCCASTLFATQKPNVMIDFSNQALSDFVYRNFARYYDIPLVCATTKLPKDLMEYMKNERKITIFQAYNLAYDVYVFTKVVAELAAKFPDCEIDVKEIHHTGKRDAPSGTALNLANAINRALGNTHTIIPNPKFEKQRGKNEIHVLSERKGSYSGTHTVIFTVAGKYRITLKHEAHSPQIFATGAIVAAEFLLRQQPGYYNMDNLFEMNSQKNIPICQCQNLPDDMNAFINAASSLVANLHGYDIDISEVYSSDKTDTHGGITYTLSNAINNALGNTHTVEWCPSLDGLRKKNEIHIHPERIGSCFGIHSVTLAVANEYTIELQYEALSSRLL